MTREEAKELLPIMQAFAEGKTIEIFDDVMGWVKTENLAFNLSPEFYRTNSKPKSNPKYRPFNSVQEAWDEMAKHSPFGWVRFKEPYNVENIRRAVSSISAYEGLLSFAVSCPKELHCYDADKMFEIYEFADGKPFGIMEE